MEQGDSKSKSPDFRGLCLFHYTLLPGEWKLTCPVTDEWIKKMWYINTMDCYSAMVKNEVMPWMQLEIIILSEALQKEIVRCHMMLLICGI